MRLFRLLIIVVPIVRRLLRNPSVRKRLGRVRFAPARAARRPGRKR